MKFEDKVENVEVTMNGRQVALGCNYGGARYHVWLDTRNAPLALTIAAPYAPMEPIYKNPPMGVKPGSPGFYRTRQHSIDSQFGQRLVGVMVERMRSENLLLKAEEAELERKRVEEAILLAASVKRRKEAAAEDLYDALIQLLAAAHGGGNPFEAMEVARQALAKADLGEVVKVQS